MLVRITNSCRMGCSHCMVEASPSGKHMPLETFREALKFSTAYDPFLLFISGGEPTDHPEFLEFLGFAKHYMTQGRVQMVLIASNGMFLEDKPYTKEILKMGIPFQITNDSRYYPKKICKEPHKLLVFEDNLRLVSPMGRAVTNNIKIDLQYPLCFNLRSLCNNYRDFNFAVKHLRTIAKMCIPSINVDGAVVAGEAPSCYKIGTVESSNEEITENILKMKCGKCGLQNNLKGKYQDLWEEMEDG